MQGFVVAGGLALLAGLALMATGLLARGPARSDPQAGVRAGEEVPVTAMHQGRAVASNSPELAVDPSAPSLVAAAFRRDAPAFGCGLQLSGSEGEGWRPARPVTEATLPEGAQSCYAPEVSFGPDGRVYYLFAGLHGRGNRPMGVFLSSSDDRGRTFDAPRQVLGKRNFSVRMAVDRDRGEHGRVYLSWLHATSEPSLAAMPPPPNPIKFTASDDGGESFSDPQVVSAEDHRRVAAPTMTVAEDGTIYVAYYDLQGDQRDYKALAGPVYDGTWSLVLARSTDGGATFETTVVDDEVRPVERVMLIFTMAPPALAAGPDGRVCLGWPHAHEDHGDVRVRCSPDQGQSWLQATRVNQDPGSSGAIHLLPQLDFAPNGRLDVTFVARNPGRQIQHTYYAASRDGGASFSVRRQVSSRASSARIGQRYTNNAAAEGKVEFGSRLGLLARDEQTLVMWPDTRNSRRGTTAQDLFAARLAHPAASRGGVPGLALAGGGLAVAGAAAAAVGVWPRRGVGRRPGDADRVAAASASSDATERPSDAVAHTDSADPAAGEAHPRNIEVTDAGVGGGRPAGRRWGRRLGWGLATVVAVAVVVGLGWSGRSPAQLPADPPQVTVALDGDGLEIAEPVSAGRVVVEVVNRGEVAHGLTMLPMGDDEAPIGKQLTNDTAEIRAPFAGVPPLDPGESARFAVDLAPDQRYALYDTTTKPDDAQERSHAETGWHVEVRTAAGPNPVGNSAPQPSPPAN